MSSPEDESDPALDPAEEESLRELGERLHDDDPHLAAGLSDGRRARPGAPSRGRRRCRFGFTVATVAVLAAVLLVAVGPALGVAMVVVAVVLAVLTTSPEVTARWRPDGRGSRA